MIFDKIYDTITLMTFHGTLMTFNETLTFDDTLMIFIGSHKIHWNFHDTSVILMTFNGILLTFFDTPMIIRCPFRRLKYDIC